MEIRQQLLEYSLTSSAEVLLWKPHHLMYFNRLLGTFRVPPGFPCLSNICSDLFAQRLYDVASKHKSSHCFWCILLSLFLLQNVWSFEKSSLLPSTFQSNVITWSEIAGLQLNFTWEWGQPGSTLGEWVLPSLRAWLFTLFGNHKGLFFSNPIHCYDAVGISSSTKPLPSLQRVCHQPCLPSLLSYWSCFFPS